MFLDKNLFFSKRLKKNIPVNELSVKYQESHDAVFQSALTLIHTNK